MTAVGLLGTMALATACVESPTNKEPDPTYSTTQYGLQPVQDCDQLEKRIENALVEQVLRDRYSANFGLEVDAAAGDASSMNNANGGRDTSSSPDDYTTTNVQEAGVDEVDIVKTDGNHIYLADHGDVVILKSWPAEETEELARVTIGQDSYSQGLFLHGDRLLAISAVWDQIDDQDYFNGTRITVIDISDRANPKIERRIDVEGWSNDARMIDGEVYIVSNTGLRLQQDYWDIVWTDDDKLPEPEWDADDERQEELRAEARPIVRKRVRRYLDGHDVRELLPRQRLVDSSGQGRKATTPMYACSDVYVPSVVAQAGMLNLTHVDLDDGGKPAIRSTGVMANGWQVYASQDNLYVAMTSRWWWWGWGNQENETHIHKFGLEGPKGRPEYVASGKVEGWLLNQFSMSEYEGHLRVATTDNEFTWNQATQEQDIEGGNHLTVLKQDGPKLVETGAVRNLAPGEQVYAARMIGDRGYVVTFRQTDPLFTFDLSDPTNPKLEGELKVNGFSSYIHPMGDDHLLTIGQDADDDGRVTGVHLQIFDVSDMKNPTRTHQEKISTGSWSSWSEAMWDHHAFTYHQEKGILAVPVNIYDWQDQNGENFSGLLVYRANENGFTELGRVNHGDLVKQYWCGTGQTDCPEYTNSWWTSVRRSIFMDDYLFSISDVGVKVNDLTDPSNEYVGLMLQ